MTAKPRLIVPFNDHAKVQFAEAEPGACVAQIPAAPELTNHMGTVHGGALFTVAEAASGRAFLEALLAHAPSAGWDLAQLSTVVRSARIHFRKPARGAISAHAHVVTPTEQWAGALAERGKATAEVSVDIKDASGTFVANMQVEWHLGRAA